MTSLHRVVVEWSGPGVNGRACNVLYFSASDNVAPPAAAIGAAYNQIGEILPNGVKTQAPSSGDTINDVDGSLIGSWSTAPVGPGMGGAAGGIAAGVGACIGWSTGGIVNGTKGPRRLRGRTFIVPLATMAYDTDGTLTTVAMTKLENFAAALQAAGPLAIWHRPTVLAPSGGNSYGVGAHRIRDKVAVLRSRRD